MKICADFFWNFRMFFFTLHFHFTSTNATRSLFERLLSLLILYPLVLFFWSLRVFPFLSPFFRPVEFFIGLGCPFVFSIDNLSSHFLNLCKLLLNFPFLFFPQKTILCASFLSTFSFFLSSFVLWSFVLRVFSSLRGHVSLFVQCFFLFFARIFMITFLDFLLSIFLKNRFVFEKKSSKNIIDPFLNFCCFWKTFIPDCFTTFRYRIVFHAWSPKTSCHLHVFLNSLWVKISSLSLCFCSKKKL